MGSRYRSTGAVSRRRALRNSKRRYGDRDLKRSIRVHEVGSENTYIESGKRYSAAHRQKARTAAARQGGFAAAAASTARALPWSSISHFAAYVMRSLALLCCFVVIANTFLGGGARQALMWLTGFASRFVPAAISGLYVFQSPFGGAFRGDIAIVAIMFFVLDWVFCVISASLRD